jgi:hypothetical protein
MYELEQGLNYTSLPSLFLSAETTTAAIHAQPTGQVKIQGITSHNPMGLHGLLQGYIYLCVML